MSTRYEGAEAGMLKFSIVGEGEEIGEDTVPAGEIALVLSYDEVFYIQGTPEELVRLLSQAIRAVGWHEQKVSEENG